MSLLSVTPWEVWPTTNLVQLYLSLFILCPAMLDISKLILIQFDLCMYVCVRVCLYKCILSVCLSPHYLRLAVIHFIHFCACGPQQNMWCATGD